MSADQTERRITALYERLSRDDDLTGDSNFIIDQKRYLEDYAAQRGYGNCAHYTDDGWSGGNFERPPWRQLIADIEAGKVAHVLVKDMSRIGRDCLQTGFYTEVFFRQRRRNAESRERQKHEKEAAAVWPTTKKQYAGGRAGKSPLTRNWPRR